MVLKGQAEDWRVKRNTRSTCRLRLFSFFAVTFFQGNREQQFIVVKDTARCMVRDTAVHPASRASCFGASESARICRQCVTTCRKLLAAGSPGSAERSTRG